MDEIRLEPQTFDSISHPGSISSGVLGPCIAIGVFSQKLNTVYMLHVGQPDLSALPEQFNGIVFRENEPNDLVVYITGGSYDSRNDDNERQALREARAFMRRLVKELYSGAKVTWKWGKTNHDTELFFSTISRRFKTVSQPA